MTTTTTDALDLARIRQAVASGQAREVRRRARLSQAEVAKAIGSSREAVAAWEGGRRLPQGADFGRRYLALLDALERQTGGGRA
jgi:DNA-binding transcriptional regulator YiaG